MMPEFYETYDPMLCEFLIACGYNVVFFQATNKGFMFRRSEELMQAVKHYYIMKAIER